MNLAIAILLACSVAVWMDPWSSMRLASLNLARTKIWHVEVLDALRNRAKGSDRRQLDTRAVIDSLAAFEMELRFKGCVKTRNYGTPCKLNSQVHEQRQQCCAGCRLLGF